MNFKDTFNYRYTDFRIFAKSDYKNTLKGN